jgi:O-6-methylguanine DNA methyltransferase
MVEYSYRPAIGYGSLALVLDVDDGMIVGCRPELTVNEALPEALPDDELKRILDAHFSGNESIGLGRALRYPSGTREFTRMVWDRLRDIPPGQTLTYGEIATALGRPGAARAVGSACSRNRIAVLVPCHRAVGADGPGGYAWGAGLKERLLRLEGAHPEPSR